MRARSASPQKSWPGKAHSVDRVIDWCYNTYIQTQKENIMFGFLTKMKETATLKAAERAAAEEVEQFNSRASYFADLIDIAKDFTFVKFNGTNLNITHDGYSDATLALKELRVLKKKAAVNKREITAQYKEIRDEYSQSVGNRSSLSLLTGTGKFGTVIRAGVRAGRAAERAQMANVKQQKENAVAPWDAISDVLDRMIIKIEGAKIKYEVEGKK